MSFARRVKNQVKEAVRFIQDFEQTAIELAAEQEYDYVICGHIHRPQMRTAVAGNKRVTYLNAGDWVENLTALEYRWGRWSIYEYDEADYEVINPRIQVNGAGALELEKEEIPAKKLKPKDVLARIFPQASPNSGEKASGASNL